MTKTCATCQCWDNGICNSDYSDIFQTGANNACPFWENYDVEMLGDEDD